MNRSVGIINGTDVYINNEFTKEIQIRKHKKHRTNKKWLKRYGTKTVNDENACFMVDGIGIITTTKVYNKLKEIK